MTTCRYPPSFYPDVCAKQLKYIKNLGEVMREGSTRMLRNNDANGFSIPEYQLVPQLWVSELDNDGLYQIV